jgi:hypothetical protein
MSLRFFGQALTMIAALVLAPALAIAQTYEPPKDPYQVTGPPLSAMSMRDSAFRQGTVGKAWVGLVLEFSATNGGATTAQVFMVRPDGNGTPLIDAGLIHAASQGDRLDAFFHNGLLYVTNSVYGPNEAHCCNTKMAVQLFGVNRNATELTLLTTKRVPAAYTQQQIVAAVKAP